MSFREAQQAVDQWVGQFEQGYFSPLANVARLAEEVGELAAKSIIDSVPSRRRQTNRPDRWRWSWRTFSSS